MKTERSPVWPLLRSYQKILFTVLEQDIEPLSTHTLQDTEPLSSHILKDTEPVLTHILQDTEPLHIHMLQDTQDKRISGDILLVVNYKAYLSYLYQT